jgi:putative transcriptional regulator
MRDELFNELVTSLKEAKAIMRGEMAPSRVFHIDNIDVKNIRDKLRLTQKQFASLLGISLGTLRNWEQGRRTPEGPAKILLLVAAQRPETLLDIVKNSVQPVSLPYNDVSTISTMVAAEEPILVLNWPKPSTSDSPLTVHTSTTTNEKKAKL